MAGSRSLLWGMVAACFALFAAVQVGATLQDPVMWILVHHRLKQARIDPIVSPGGVSSHVHSLVGANGVSAVTTTAEDLDKASTCTTSGITADMSAYWAPTLYSFNSNNDTFAPRPLSYVNTYYLARGNVPIVAFPRGLQLLAGNAMRTGPGPTKQTDNIVSFVCLNYAQGSSQATLLPPGPCPQGLRTQIVFPSCWNGKDLVSQNHTHVVYPLGDNADNGPCPETHNVRLPTLFYEFVWGVDGQDNTGNSTWVFSNGDAIGYSFHADFIAAWDETVLQSALDDCGGNLFNDLESCPSLAETLDRPKSAACNTTSTEAIDGTIASLPGCNVIWNGPHMGKGLTPGCDPNKVMLKPPGWPDLASASSMGAVASSTSATAPSKTSNVVAAAKGKAGTMAKGSQPAHKKSSKHKNRKPAPHGQYEKQRPSHTHQKAKQHHEKKSHHHKHQHQQ